MDSSVVVAETGAHSAPAGVDPDPPRTVTLDGRAKRLGILAAVLCPCHLPLVATALAIVGFGGAAATLRDNRVVSTAGLAVLAVVSLWLAIRYSRAARVCALPPPPRSQRAQGRER